MDATRSLAAGSPRPVRAGVAMVAAVALAVALGLTGCAARTTAHPGAAPPATSSAPPPPTSAAPNPGTRPNPSASPTTTTLPPGRVERLNAIQAVGPRTAWAVGTGTILTTGDGGRTWVRVWRGTQELDEVDFVNASTGWALGDHILLGTVDGGQHWRRLGQPRSGPLRRIHFSSPTEGWGVAGGDRRPDPGLPPQGATRLVHTSNGGRTWSTMDAPAAPQSVCFTALGEGWLASDRSVWRSTDGGRHWGTRPSFTLPVAPDEPSFSATLQCAAPGAAWVRFDSDDHYAGHGPYAMYASGDAGAHWRGVLGTLGAVLTVRLPGGPGSYPGPFSVIDPERAFLLSPSPAAERTGAVMISQGGGRLRRLPGIPGTALFMPHSVSFANATRGWAVGANLAGRAVILATGDGGRSWRSQLRG